MISKPTRLARRCPLLPAFPAEAQFAARDALSRVVLDGLGEETAS
jgi:hypothetical protein